MTQRSEEIRLILVHGEGGSRMDPVKNNPNYGVIMNVWVVGTARDRGLIGESNVS